MKRNPKYAHCCLSVLTLLSVLIICGCGSSKEQSVGGDESRLRILGRLYGEFLSQHNSQAPKNEAELIEFIDKSSEFLKTQGIESSQELFISPRDEEPLVVLYGKDMIPDGPGGLPWVAYESKGANGKKFLIGARGTTEEMTPEQIEAIISR
jgi:hypothetical protein